MTLADHERRPPHPGVHELNPSFFASTVSDCRRMSKASQPCRFPRRREGGLGDQSWCSVKGTGSAVSLAHAISAYPVRWCRIRLDPLFRLCQPKDPFACSY
jgi:hypothetical protein